MKSISILLFPISCIYHSVTNIRNFLYNSGFLKSHSFEIPIICIGNLRVGGTGKTPFVDFLTTFFLSRGYKVSILSRGYGRKTRGFLKAGTSSTSEDIGDEPFQYFLSYNGKVKVFVDEDRPNGIRGILKDEDKSDIVLLDDAYQHRPVKAKVNILLSEYKRPFYNDFLMPSGRLRESRSGVSRADILIITKCPDTLIEEDITIIKSRISNYTKGNIPVYFTKILYSDPVSLFKSNVFQNEREFVLVCGIDNPEPFIQHCENNFIITAKFIYKDHHSFSKEDISKIKEINLPILTTKKDNARLKLWESEFLHIPVYYIPIKIGFIDNENDFLMNIKKLISA